MIQKDMDKINGIISDYQNGLGMKPVCRKYHISYRTVSKILKEHNVNIKSPFGTSKVSADEVARLYNNGLSTCQISEQLHVNTSTVLRALKTKGIDTSRGLNVKTPDDVERNIIQSYQNRLTLKQIAELHQVSESTAFNILKRNNCTIRPKEKLSQDDKYTAAQLYLSGLSTHKIAGKLNVSVGTACKALKELNVDRNNRYGSPNLYIDYWNSIDTPEQAYFLGLLLTDGNVFKNQIRIQLKSEDKYILELLKKLTNSDSAIRTHIHHKSGASTAIFSTCCKNWVKDLARFYVYPGKTFTCHLPVLSEDLMPHLLRGCIDGDGWITKQGKCIGFCGNQFMVSELQQYLVNTLNVYNVKVREDNGLYSISWCGKSDVKKIGEYLYKNSTNLRLERKYKAWSSNPCNNFCQTNPEVSIDSK